MYYKILNDEQMVCLLKWQYGIKDKLAWQIVKSINSVIKMDELMKNMIIEMNGVKKNDGFNDIIYCVLGCNYFSKWHCKFDNKRLFKEKER